MNKKSDIGIKGQMFRINLCTKIKEHIKLFRYRMKDRKKRLLLNQLTTLYNEVVLMIEKDGGKWEIIPTTPMENRVWGATVKIYHKHYLDLINELNKIYSDDAALEMLGEKQIMNINSLIHVKIVVQRALSFVKSDIEYKENENVENLRRDFEERFRKIDDQLYKIHGDLVMIKKDMKITIADEDREN